MIKNFFATIGRILVSIFHSIFYTKREYDTLMSRYNDLLGKYTVLDKDYNNDHQRLLSLTETCDGLSAELEQVTKDLMTKLAESIQENERLTAEIKRIQEGIEVDKEFLRAVQKQLAEEFNMHPVFGFPRSPGLPGSVSMDTCRVGVTTDDPGVVVHRGRVILDDHETRQINQLHHLYDKCQIALNHLRRYGSMERIVESLISNGAMTMTLAYRDETTTYELFYEISAKSHAADSILVFDDKTGCVMNKDERNGEG